MSGEVNCDGDGKSSEGFTNIERMRFRSLTYEIIEELRMRRDLDNENERKIQLLLQDKFELGRKLDVELAKLANKEEHHEADLRESKRQMEDKMREFQIDASQQQVARKIAEKENEALKDEIRKLQLLNYSLQKQIREHDRLEKVQATEREQHIRQMSQFEAQFNQVTSLTKEVSGKQMKLEKDRIPSECANSLDLDQAPSSPQRIPACAVKEVEHLNHLLRYENHHHKCILKLKNADISRLQDELVNRGITEQTLLKGDKDNEIQLNNEIDLLKEKLATTKKQYEDLSEETELWKNRYWGSLKTLEEAHRLVNVNLHTAAQYKKECEEAEEKNRVTVEKLDGVEADLSNTQQSLDSLKVEKDEALEEWMSKKKELENEINHINQQLGDQREKYEELERANEQTKQEKLDADHEIETLKAILNRERSESCVQTDLCLMCMIDTGIQASTDMTDKEMQTDSKLLTTCSAQTINAAMHSSSVQTDKPVVPDLISTESQTDQAVIIPEEAQTDINLKHMTTHYKDTELVGKDVQTDKQLLVDKLTQTERFTYDQSKETADLSSTFTEAQSNSHDGSQSSKYADRFNINQVFSGNVGRPGRTDDMDFPGKGAGLDITRDESEPDFVQKPALSDIPKTSAYEAHFVKNSMISCMPNSSTDDGPALNVGINVRDLEISESVKTVSRFVEVDPKEYALALTPQMKKDNQTGKGGKSVNTDTANNASYVNDPLIDEDLGDEAIELIDDSDGDDVVDPSQPCPSMMELSDDKLDNNTGSKHRLSLSGKRGNTCGGRAQGKQDRDTEASCSATKHLKFSELDEDISKADGSMIREDALKELTSSGSGGRHRIVARSGQKVDKCLISVAPRKAKTQLSFGLPGPKRGNASHASPDTVATGIYNTARSKDDAQACESVPTSTISNKYSNQKSYSLAGFESGGAMLCQSNSFADTQSSYSTVPPAELPRSKGIYSSENTCMHNLSEPSRSLSTPSPSSLRPNQRTVASSQLNFGNKPTILPNELSNVPSLLSSSGPEVTQTTVSMPSVSQQVPIGTSTSQLATSSNATGNHQAGTLQLLSSSTASGSEETITRSVEQSLPSASGSVFVPCSVPITRTLSSKPTSSSAVTVQQPESRTSPNETEPAFLKKYREIVAKIKPISTPVQTPTPRSSARKGKQLYSSTVTPLLPTTSGPTDEVQNQFSAECLATSKSNLKGILKGNANKEKGSKSVSWNS